MRHIRDDCGKEPRFRCSYCAYKAYQKINLINHITKMHAAEEGEWQYEDGYESSQNNYDDQSDGYEEKYNPLSLLETRITVQDNDGNYSLDDDDNFKGSTPDIDHLQSVDPYCPKRLKQDPDADLSEVSFIGHSIGMEFAPTTRRRRFVEPPDLKCPTCERQYKTPHSLRFHMRHACGKEPRFFCTVCDYKSFQKVHLKNHVTRNHKSRLGEVMRAQKTPQPGQSSTTDPFPSPRGSEMDVDYDEGSLPENGDENGEEREIYVEVKSSEKSGNKKAKFSKPHKCAKCGRKYQWSGSLQRHVRDECGKEPKYSCEHCEYKGYQKVHLDNHMASKHPNVTTEIILDTIDDYDD